MTTPLPPICTGCTRRTGSTFTCDAYPDGIPDQILLSEVDHRKPFTGDNGKQFVPQGPDDAQYAEVVFGGLRPRPEPVSPASAQSGA